MKTNREIVENCNALARKYYAMQGYQVDESFKFYQSTFPAEVLCWEMAMAAYDFIEGTEVDGALDEWIDDQVSE